MTVSVNAIANTNTFDFWRNRTNELANAMSTVAVTVNSNTATGNAAITGTFTAGILQSNTGTFSANGLTTTGNSAQLLDSYAISTIRGAEYFISVKDNNANAYQATKVLTVHNVVNAFSTEYATILSNTSLGVFDANVASNATHVTLYITPTSSNTTVNFTKVTF
jgi:hypothetical protein